MEGLNKKGSALGDKRKQLWLLSGGLRLSGCRGTGRPQWSRREGGADGGSREEPPDRAASRTPRTGFIRSLAEPMGTDGWCLISEKNNCKPGRRLRSPGGVFPLKCLPTQTEWADGDFSCGEGIGA